MVAFQFSNSKGTTIFVVLICILYIKIYAIKLSNKPISNLF